MNVQNFRYICTVTWSRSRTVYTKDTKDIDSSKFNCLPVVTKMVPIFEICHRIMDVAYEVRKANIPKVEYTFPYKLLESRKEIRRKNQEPKLTKKKKYIYIYIYIYIRRTTETFRTGSRESLTRAFHHRGVPFARFASRFTEGPQHGRRLGESDS